MNRWELTDGPPNFRVPQDEISEWNRSALALVKTRGILLSFLHELSFLSLAHKEESLSALRHEPGGIYDEGINRIAQVIERQAGISKIVAVI
jgi:hypothetical protein